MSFALRQQPGPLSNNASIVGEEDNMGDRNTITAYHIVGTENGALQ